MHALWLKEGGLQSQRPDSKRPVSAPGNESLPVRTEGERSNWRIVPAPPGDFLTGNNVMEAYHLIIPG